MKSFKKFLENKKIRDRFQIIPQDQDIELDIGISFDFDDISNIIISDNYNISEKKIKTLLNLNNINIEKKEINRHLMEVFGSIEFKENVKPILDNTIEQVNNFILDYLSYEA